MPPRILSIQEMTKKAPIKAQAMTMNMARNMLIS